MLRACRAVSEESWLCMARALQALDVEVTGRCREASVGLRAVAARQRKLYAPCLAPEAAEALACALISADDDCLARACGG